MANLKAVSPNDKRVKTVDKILELLNGYSQADVETILDWVSDKAETFYTLNFKLDDKD